MNQIELGDENVFANKKFNTLFKDLDILHKRINDKTST
jgi:hypothetical protein